MLAWLQQRRQHSHGKNFLQSKVFSLFAAAKTSSENCRPSMLGKKSERWNKKIWCRSYDQAISLARFENKIFCFALKNALA
jgi:hypothetical protein